MELHPSGEDYLKAIFLLQRQRGKVRSIDLARYMGYSKPSISRAVSLLKRCGLLTVSNGFLDLTEEGWRTAAYLYEKHSIITSLLVRIGVSPETARSDACRIEHSISDESFQKLKRWVGNSG